jgi:hypothetical protein
MPDSIRSGVISFALLAAFASYAQEQQNMIVRTAGKETDQSVKAALFFVTCFVLLILPSLVPAHAR